MNWQEIRVSADSTRFLFEDEPIFSNHFLEVLKFHAPGLAPVKDLTGAYHINSAGQSLYPERYTRTFGYYCGRAAVVKNKYWFHLNEKGFRVYAQDFLWTGNYQENLCTVRDTENRYFHIDLNGERIYPALFLYAGDYKDGIACVKTSNVFYKHIDTKGNFLNDREFLDLGIFHKNFATAKDEVGWYHIDKLGLELYKQRYTAVEPFYNGFALVTLDNNQKIIIDERGNKIVKV